MAIEITKVMFWYFNHTSMPLFIHSTSMSTYLLFRQNIGQDLRMKTQHSFVLNEKSNRKIYIFKSICFDFDF